MDDEPAPRLDRDYMLPRAGIRRDRETAEWFVGVFDARSGPVEHGPFGTEDEARTALAKLVSNATQTG